MAKSAVLVSVCEDTDLFDRFLMPEQRAATHEYEFSVHKPSISAALLSAREQADITAPSLNWVRNVFILGANAA